MKMSKFLHKIFQYFLKNILKTIYAAGLLLGMLVLLTYFTSIHYLPPMEIGPLVYLIVVLALNGVVAILGFFLFICGFGVFTRATLPEKMPDIFEERMNIIFKFFGTPHFIIMLMILWILNYINFNISLIWFSVFMISAIVAAIVLIILNRYGFEKNKLFKPKSILPFKMSESYTYSRWKKYVSIFFFLGYVVC